MWKLTKVLNTANDLGLNFITHWDLKSMQIKQTLGIHKQRSSSLVTGTLISAALT